jgi:hypothetical protein
VPSTEGKPSRRGGRKKARPGGASATGGNGAGAASGRSQPSDAVPTEGAPRKRRRRRRGGQGGSTAGPREGAPREGRRSARGRGGSGARALARRAARARPRLRPPPPPAPRGRPPPRTSGGAAAAAGVGAETDPPAARAPEAARSRGLPDRPRNLYWVSRRRPSVAASWYPCGSRPRIPYEAAFLERSSASAPHCLFAFPRRARPGVNYWGSTRDRRGCSSYLRSRSRGLRWRVGLEDDR